MADNGSPNPVFETDESRYVLVTIPLKDDVDSGTIERIFSTLEDGLHIIKKLATEPILELGESLN